MSAYFKLEQTTVETVAIVNFTYNLSPMWELASVYSDLLESEGKKASDIVTNLEKGLNLMKKYPDSFILLEPENKWGTYEVAVSTLSKIVTYCKEYPDSIVSLNL